MVGAYHKALQYTNSLKKKRLWKGEFYFILCFDDSQGNF
jgi:hypothetical protein